MIVHRQNKGMNSPARFRASLTEGIKEQAPICVVPINRLLMIPPTHPMIHCSWEFDSQLACHAKVSEPWSGLPVPIFAVRPLYPFPCSNKPDL